MYGQMRACMAILKFLEFLKIEVFRNFEEQSRLFYIGGESIRLRYTSKSGG